MPIESYYDKYIPSFHNKNCHGQNGILHFPFLETNVILLRYTIHFCHVTLTESSNLYIVITVPLVKHSVLIVLYFYLYLSKCTMYEIKILKQTTHTLMWSYWRKFFDINFVY